MTLNFCFAHRRLCLSARSAAVVATALAAVALATEMPADCSTSDPGRDVMNCKGVKRSLMQTDFKRSPQLQRTSTAVIVSSAAFAASAALETTVQEGGSAVQHGRGTSAKGTLAVAGEASESLMKESTVTVQDGVNSIVSRKEAVDAYSVPLGSAHVPKEAPELAQPLLSEMAFWRAKLGILLKVASDKVQVYDSRTAMTSTPIILCVAVALVLVISCACVFGLLHEDEEPQAARSWGNQQEQRPSLLVPPSPILPDGTRGQGQSKDAREGTNPIASSLALHKPRAPPVSYANSGELCPSLLVPQGVECVLALRTFTCAVAECAATHPLVLDVVDLQGRKVLSAHVAYEVAARASEPPGGLLPAFDFWEQSSSVVSLPPKSSPQAFITLLNPASAADGVSESRHVLSECRLDGAGGLNVYNADGELFGHLTRDADNPRYSFGRSAGGNDGLSFDGIFHDHTTIVTDKNHNQLAFTEPATMAFDPQSKFYKIRVSPGVDVGLVVSLLVGIDAMEATSRGGGPRRHIQAASRSPLLHDRRR